MTAMGRKRTVYIKRAPKRKGKSNYVKKRWANKRRSNYRNSIPRTIQSAAYKPKSVVCRHFYQNSFKIGSTDFTAGTQKNCNIKLTPNCVTIFDSTALDPEWQPALAVNPIYNTVGVTTYQDLLTYQTAYRSFQVLGVRYDVNVRMIKNLAIEDVDKEYPLKIIFNQSTTRPTHANDLTLGPEAIEDRPFCQSRTMQQTPGVVSKGVSLVMKHSTRLQNNIPKTSWLGHTDYAGEITNAQNLGNPLPTGQLNGVPLENDFVNLYITSASSAAIAKTPELLVTLKASYVVRYTEPSFVTNESFPILHH